MLAPLVAREMDLPEVVVPAAPAVFSAWGMLMSNLEYDLGQTVLTMLDDAALAQMEGVFAQLETEAAQVLAAQSVPAENRLLLRRLDLRYNGQEHTLSVDLQRGRRHAFGGRPVPSQACGALRPPVDGGSPDPHRPGQAVGRLEKPSAHLGASRVAATEGIASHVGDRYAFDFATRERRLFPIHERSLLEAGVEIDGPAIIREPTSVTIVHGDQKVVPDHLGNLVVRLQNNVAT